MAGASRRSRRAQSEWNVETHMRAAVRAEQRLDARAHFFGGLLVKVTARTSCGSGMPVADEVGDTAR